MDFQDYKKFHENHMLNNTGSTAWETGLVLASIPVGTFLSLWITAFTQENIIPVIDFIIIIFPMVFNVTVLSDVVYLTPLIFWLLSSTIFFLNFQSKNLREVLNEKLPSKKDYITNYRASTNFVSVLCILAVDFTIFPKKFVKTETFGYGLMDLGVGFFVCSNGIVVKHLSSGENFFKVIKSTLVLILLGVIRLFSIKSTDYHEHVAEYGLHWNFFFTLAFCKLCSHLVISMTNLDNPFLLTLITSITHQFALSSGLQDWVFSDIPRNSFLSANREGLVSSLGYVSLYFAAVSLGRIINDVQPNVSRKMLLIYLSTTGIILWLITCLCYKTVGVSRRLANLGYNSWVMSLSITKLLQFMVAEIGIRTVKKNYNVNNGSCVPVLFESINANGLFFFLLGNVLTGIVNLMFQTLLLNTICGILIITTYMAVACTISQFMYSKQIIVKVW